MQSFLDHAMCGLTEAFPRPIQIHYGQHRRVELSKAARRSRSCAYLAYDDDHGPLALQENLLAGCPTVGVRTGASFVRHGETGIVVDRLPPGASCVECDEDAVALDDFTDAIDQAHDIDRPSVRAIAAEQFNTHCIVNDVILALKVACAVANVETKDPLQSLSGGGPARSRE